MGGDTVQEDFKVEAYGVVTSPPDLASVLAKIRQAAQLKYWLELSPAELRVLVGLLDENE